jgi:predicted DNA-binding protein (UPF0251 family)
LTRPRKPRCVRDEPAYAYFKPQGIPLRELEDIRLSVEELEALRLVDIEELYQEEAALRMEVSRPTLHRILKEARRKVATALVEGRALGIAGGDYILAGDTRIFECVACGHTWDEPFGSGVRACEAVCPKCGGGVTRKGCGKGRARRGQGPHGRFGPPGDGSSKSD